MCRIAGLLLFGVRRRKDARVETALAGVGDDSTDCRCSGVECHFWKPCTARRSGPCRGGGGDVVPRHPSTFHERPMWYNVRRLESCRGGRDHDEERGICGPDARLHRECCVGGVYLKTDGRGVVTSCARLKCRKRGEGERVIPDQRFASTSTSASPMQAQVWLEACDELGRRQPHPAGPGDGIRQHRCPVPAQNPSPSPSPCLLHVGSSSLVGQLCNHPRVWAYHRARPSVRVCSLPQSASISQSTGVTSSSGAAKSRTDRQPARWLL